jgi:hypothetical protein
LISTIIYHSKNWLIVKLQPHDSCHKSCDDPPFFFIDLQEIPFPDMVYEYTPTVLD